MDGWIAIAGALAIIVVVASKKFSARGLQRSGTPALGIILEIDSFGRTIQGSTTYFSATTSSQGPITVKDNLDVRGAVIDVEIPGRPPYQVSAQVTMPRNMADDVLPGSTVELRVDPRNRNSLTIVGPGSGFTGFARLPVTIQQDESA